MRENLFQILYAAIRSLTKFQQSNGVICVYDYPVTQPDGYPYATVVSESLASEVLDTARDLRHYDFFVSIIGEKFGEPGGFTQSQALKAAREAEDAVIFLFDSNNTFNAEGLGVIRTLPTQSKYGYTDGNSRVVLEIGVQFQLAARITM